MVMPSSLRSLLVVLLLVCSSTDAFKIRNASLLGNVFKSTASKISKPNSTYRQSLEDKILALEKELNTALEQKLHLKQLLKVANQSRLHQSSQKILKHDLKNLQEQIKKLEDFQMELFQLLKAEEKKSQQLERKLKEAQDDNNALKQQYESEMKLLQKQLVEKTKAQFEEFDALLKKSVKEAEQRGRTQALAELEKRVKEAVKEERTHGEQKLHQERIKGEKAVEKERVKMRKLVKALAEREKKLFANHNSADAENNKQAVKVPGRKMLSSSKSAKPHEARRHNWN